MKPWHNTNNCNHLRAYHEIYDVPTAAMLWCGVPPDDLEEELKLIRPHTTMRGVYIHPFIGCLEIRCRVIHDAIQNNALPAINEKGYAYSPMAVERRHVKRADLKEWIAKEHPNDKPAFLFDEIERNTHDAINVHTFRALQADRDAARAELDQSKAWAAKTTQEMDALRGERDSLRAMVDKMSAPSERSEKTYLNIIGGLLDLMLRESPNSAPYYGKPYSLFENQSAVISAFLGHYGHVKGVGDSNLEKILAKAKKTLKDSLIPGG